MYYPQSQIKTNLYTNGQEFSIESTKENYIGYYWKTSDGKYFTGKTPNDKNIQELADYSKREQNIEIKIESQEIIFGNKAIKFDLDAFKKKCLMEGLDDIALSLKKSESIQEYETKIKNSNDL